MRPRSTNALLVAFVLLGVYVLTLAPGLTFWDAGEFIAAAYGFGIPHPPGTPLFVAIDHLWVLVLGPMVGVAYGSNLLSAVSTALAGALAVVFLTRELPRGSRWAIASGVLCAGLGTSVWANATETEVYSIALLHAMLMLVAAQNASHEEEDNRWLLVTAYLFALAPALHLSALVAAPAAIVTAARRPDGEWRRNRILLLAGGFLLSAGTGVMSPLVSLAGVALIVARFAIGRTRSDARVAVRAIALMTLGASALAILILRARQDPALNQGSATTFGALINVVSRHQYDLVPLWPRRAPLWLQGLNVLQYADWQFGMSLGDGIFTSPWRVSVMAVFVLFAISGWRRLSRDAPRAAVPLGVLLLCGTVGVCAYLNLKAGASIGYGIVGDDAHESRERDYFFVLGFWAWAMFAAYGLHAIIRARGWKAGWVMALPLVPLAANWPVNQRRGDDADAPVNVAHALLSDVPRHGVLFLAADNDTYPVWYVQLVEGFRPDVTTITVPLLPADWYFEQVKQRSHLTPPPNYRVDGATYLHELRAGLLAGAARASGRPIAVTTQITALQRSMIGSQWRLHGAVYLAGGAPVKEDGPPAISAESRTRNWLTEGRSFRSPDDVTNMMYESLACGELGRLSSARSPRRDSLETRCNFR